MKKLIPLLLIFAILAGIAMANLGERRIYPLPSGIRYRFTGSRDPNNFWDDMNDVYTIHGLLEVDDINTPKFKGKDVNIPGDLTLSGLTKDRLLYLDNDSNVASVADLTAWIAGTLKQITVTGLDGKVTLSLPQDYDTGATPILGGLTLINAITEFSTDGTMGDNSDSAVPTEAAVVTYVGAAGGGYQPLDDVLTDLSALTAVADNEFIVGTGAGTYAHESGDTARTSLGLGTGDSPTFVKTTLTGNEINIATAQTPASSTATGTTGDIAWDADYIYVAVAGNTWKRAALTTWAGTEDVIYAGEDVIYAGEQVAYL